MLVAVGVAAWAELDGAARWFGVVGAPAALMIVWGTFNVPGDPSRGGGAPVTVSGRTRLVIEFVFFAVGAAALILWTGSVWLAAGFVATVIVHYVLSLDRVGWLMTK